MAIAQRQVLDTSTQEHQHAKSKCVTTHSAQAEQGRDDKTSSQFLNNKTVTCATQVQQRDVSLSKGWGTSQQENL